MMNSTMIPYQIRATLLQLEPSTDLNWEEVLLQIFETENIAVKEEIDRQILKPKDIQWNRVTNTFEYKITSSLSILKHGLQSDRMRAVATKLSDSIQWLKEITDSVQIADYLENALHQIDLIPVDDDLNLQQEKLLIRRVFLQDVAKRIRKLNLQPLQGIRHLSSAAIKCFIVEVFIKQQLLGYWFKPLLSKKAELRNHPFFKYYIVIEQNVRKFDIVKTSEFIFLIAPIQNFSQNPYSIRRFLFEDKIEYNDQVYVTGLILDVDKINDEDYKDQVDFLMQKMVTIQSQVHRDVIEIVQDFEMFSEKKLLPFLMEPMQMMGGDSDAVAQSHLKSLEQMITANILMPLRNAVKNDLSHIEEFEYLFLSVYRIFSEILSHYREFKAQPALFFNHAIQLFEYRLLAYLKLLEKRKDEIFIPMNVDEWQIMHSRSEQPAKAIHEILVGQMQDYRDIVEYTEQLRKEQSKSQGSFLKRIMKGEKLEKDIQQASQAATRIKQQTYMDILVIPKKLSKYSIFIEFESLISLREMERHYAFPNGDNGLMRLPLLMKLPENPTDFDMEDFYAAVKDYDMKF